MVNSNPVGGAQGTQSISNTGGAQGTQSIPNTGEGQSPLINIGTLPPGTIPIYNYPEVGNP